MADPGAKSLLIVPILLGGEVWGSIGLHFDSHSPRGDSELEALKAAAGTISAALQRREVERALARTDSILEAVSLAAGGFLRQESFASSVQQLLSRLGQATLSMRAFLGEYHTGDDQVLRFTKTREWSEQHRSPLISRPELSNLDVRAAGMGELVEALAAGQVIQTHTRKLGPEEQKFFWGLDPNLNALIAAPITVDGQLWGVIGLEQESERTWTTSEIEALRLGADICGTALRRLQAEAERQDAVQALQRRDRILQAVRIAAARFLKSGSWTQYIDEVLSYLGKAAEVSRVYIFEHEHTGTEFTSHVKAEWLAPGVRSIANDPIMKGFRPKDLGLSQMEEALSKGKTTSGHTRLSPPDEQQILRAQAVKSYIAVPIFLDDRWWGTIGWDDCQQERQWTRNEIDALEAAADTLAAAISNSRSFEQIGYLRRQLELENEYLREKMQEVRAFGNMVGESDAMRKVYSLTDGVAPTHSTVLILGESGTGKELIARAIHERSPRHTRTLVKVNCASIPRELFESEFFGHVKGSFTGALRDRAGRFELADGGTLLLDEVAEIPYELQGKLLRVLQEGEFEPIGEDRPRKVDVRVIAATNRRLEDYVEAGRFRRDLYYRLSVFPITVPPLRDRTDDIPLLALHFLTHFAKHYQTATPNLKQKHIIALQEYHWPGNVRELRNLIERAVIKSRDGGFTLDLPGSESSQKSILQVASLNREILTEVEFREFERANLRAALEECGGRIYGPAGAATLLGLPPSTLASRLRTLGIKRNGGLS
jgi:transcriptional regulator with GAF, ATPase, and Fis domain